MIRSLDIRQGASVDQLLVTPPKPPKIPAKPAVWLLDIAPKRRVSLHMFQAMSGLPRPPKRRWRLWHYLALSWLLPSIAALSVIAALAILRKGLL
jgi:hypothetical protein